MLCKVVKAHNHRLHVRLMLSYFKHVITIHLTTNLTQLIILSLNMTVEHGRKTERERDRDRQTTETQRERMEVVVIT